METDVPAIIKHIKHLDKMSSRYNIIQLKVVILLALVITPTENARAETTVFKVAPASGSLVKFTSKAPLETVIGHTDQITGEITFDPADFGKPVSAWFEVKMATLDTENKTRNRHMRKNHLHTDKYPVSRFELHQISEFKDKALPEEMTDFIAAGNFTLHGVTKTLTSVISASWNRDKNLIDVIARFQVSLSDYDIPRPQFLVMKLEDTQSIEVKFSAKAE